MSRKPFQLVIFEERGSGDYKAAGIQVYGKDIEVSQIINITTALPEIVDEPEEFITSNFKGDLVLNFLRHPDLSEYLVRLCMDKGIPVIASGQHIPGAICPFTCCGLGRKRGLGAYGEQFGLPEYEVKLMNGRIERLSVRRGASCGATWQVIPKITGCRAEEAISAIGRHVQYICMADPSAFDPVTGKSALHFAGEVHMNALRRAIDKEKG